MAKYPSIFDICHCGKCNEIVYGGKKYYKSSHSRIGKFHTKETKEMMSLSAQGRIILQKPWNKGLTSEIDNRIVSGENHPSKRSEVRIKISRALIGKHPSKETKKKLSEIQKGKHRSPRTEFKKGQIAPMKGRKRPDIVGDLNPAKRPEVREKLGLENHHNWKGGLSFQSYSHEFNKELKNKIRERDNYQCQHPDCLITQLESMMLWGQELSIHHIHYDKKNPNPDLITLCRKHNAKVNSNQNYYEKLFMNLLERKINFLLFQIDDEGNQLLNYIKKDGNFILESKCQI